jgi:hypothetical protein
VLETRAYDIDMSEIRARVEQIINDNIVGSSQRPGS